MIDPAYAVLAAVQLNPDLTLESPSGGRIRFTRSVEGNLRLNADRATTLWDLLDLGRAAGLLSGFRALRRLRSPLLQTLEVEIDDRDVIVWRPGRFPKIVSLRGMIDLLKSK